MKVKQIVGEHKKGHKAKIYAKKPMNTIAPKKPAPAKKPEAPMEEDQTVGTIQQTDDPNNPGKVKVKNQDGSETLVDKASLKQGAQPNSVELDGPDIKQGQTVTTKEAMLPNSVFAGSAVGQKPGKEGQLKGTDKAPKGVRAASGKLVGEMEESSDDQLLKQMLSIAGLR